MSDWPAAEAVPAPDSRRRFATLFGGLRGVPVPSMDRYAETLLAQLPEQGWACRLVRGPRAPIPEFHRLARLPITEFSRHVLYNAAARRERADVYHVTDHSFGNLVNALPKERTVVTCHDLIPWIVPGVMGEGWKRAIGLRPWEASIRAMTKAGHVACVSERTRRDLLERTGMAEERTSVIPNGISDAFTAYDAERRRETRARLGLSEDVCVVLHVGSDAAYKNVETVIRAVHRLREDGLPATFVKVGPVTEAQSAQLTGASTGVPFQRLSAPGDNALRDVYNAADVLLFPSLYEGFGFPPLEAMRCGLPVVVSTTPALVEVTAGHAPAIAPEDVEGMADAVRRIWEGRGQRDESMAAAERHAESFTWRRTAAEFAALYERLAA